MLKTLLLGVAIVVGAASLAHAGSGLALTVAGCPGNPGALGGSYGIVDCLPPYCGPPDHGGVVMYGPSILDCASGQPVVVLATWAPNEDIPDLADLDGTIDTQVPANNVSGPGFDEEPFWNFDPTGCNGGALTSSQLRPATGCNAPAFLATWNVPNSGSAIGGSRRSNNAGRIQFACYRPTPLAVTAGQNLFGVQIIIDGSNALEAGGSCAGCCSSGGFGLLWSEGRPQSFGATVPSNIYNSWGDAGATYAIGLYPAASSCASVPVRKPTWGRLKSLYR